MSKKNVLTIAAVAILALVLTAGTAQSETTIITGTANGPGSTGHNSDSWNNPDNWNNGGPFLMNHL